jgi:hypothetical protein
MTHIASALDTSAAGIESFGNEKGDRGAAGHAAPLEQWGSRNDALRYERRGAWGHMLNEHYGKRSSCHSMLAGGRRRRNARAV